MEGRWGGGSGKRGRGGSERVGREGVREYVLWYGGVVVVFTKKMMMTNDDRGHSSSFSCHVTNSGDVELVGTTMGWWWCCGMVVVWSGMVGVVLCCGGGMGCGYCVAWLYC